MEASQRHNFTFIYQRSSGGGATGVNKNGTWTGAVGDVLNRVADIAVGCALAPDRTFVVDSGMAYTGSNRIFFIKYSRARTDWKALLRAFQPNVWLSLVITATCFTLTHWLYHKFHTNGGTVANVDGKQYSNDSTNFLNAISTTVAIMLEQSTSILSGGCHRLRILIFTLVISSVVLCAGYRSRLFHFLSFNSPPQVPLTHVDLVNQNYKLFYRFFGGVAYTQALNSPDPIQRQIVQRSNLVNTSADCIIAAILTEKSACLDWESHGNFAVQRNATANAQQTNTVIFTSKDSLMRVLVGWMYRKGSPLIESFDEYTGWVLAAGVYNKLNEDDASELRRKGAKWMNQEKYGIVNRRILEIYRDYSSAYLRPLSIGNFHGIFAFFVVLITCSSVIMCAEFQIPYLRKFEFLKCESQ